MLPILLLVSAFAPLAVQGQFTQTSATCSPDFAWMANSRGVSPCQAAASIDALCNNGNWNIPKLNASVKYNNPQLSDGTATICTCSWASYNLISACITCQGFPEQIPFWGDYSTECSGKISESYWPSSITLPSSIALPFWSTSNPTTWTNQKFTPSEAKTIAQQGHPDVSASAPPKKSKSTPIGAIVGGVIGGIVVIAAFVAVALFMLRRQKKISEKNSTTFTGGRPLHSRNISDITVSSNMKSVGGWTTVTSTTPMMLPSTNPASTPTLHTHTPSVSSLPFFSSVVHSTPTQSPSPPPVPSSSQPRRPEDMVTPFTLPPTASNPDQKRSHGEWPVFDPPNAPPSSSVRMQITPMQSTPQRNRYNPPAYSESSPGDAGTSSRHPAGQALSDSDHSSPSSSNAGGPPRTMHTPANSASSIYASEIASPLSRGRSLAGPSTDHKQQPPWHDDEPSLA